MVLALRFKLNAVMLSISILQIVDYAKCFKDDAGLNCFCIVSILKHGELWLLLKYLDYCWLLMLHNCSMCLSIIPAASTTYAL